MEYEDAPENPQVPGEDQDLQGDQQAAGEGDERQEEPISLVTPPPATPPHKVPMLLDLLASETKKPRRNYLTKNSLLPPIKRFAAAPVNSLGAPSLRLADQAPSTSHLPSPSSLLPKDFIPQQTSTQRYTHEDPLPSASLEAAGSGFFDGYDSQLDTNRRIDSIGEFMQGDNDLFQAWINPDAIEDGDESQLS